MPVVRHDDRGSGLRGRELSAHWKGARHVCAVVLVLGPRVNQHQVARVDSPLRLFVVERGRVRAAADDVRVTPVVCVATLVGVINLRLDLVLPLRARGDGPSALVPLDAYVNGVLHQA